MRWSPDWQMKHFLLCLSCACMVRAILIWRLPSPPRASSRKLGMYSPSSSSWIGSPSKWSSSSEERVPAQTEQGLVTLQLRQQRQWSCGSVVYSQKSGSQPSDDQCEGWRSSPRGICCRQHRFHTSLPLVHLMRVQQAMPGYLRVQDMPDLLPDSI